MKSLKLPAKKLTKEERRKKVLIGLIEHYLETGRPVGSNILKESGFEDLSSATIRNYFAQLENEGYLIQSHSSSGRIPTAKSFRFYAEEFENEHAHFLERKEIEKYKTLEMREIAKLLREMAEDLSKLSSCATFFSAPRFDNDLLIDMKALAIDQNRILCALVTSFGQIQTEILYTDHKLTTFETKRLEGYFHWRLTGQDKPLNLEPEEELMAQKFYNETMVRFLASYSSVNQEDLLVTGFSNLLNYPELRDANVLAKTLAVLENSAAMRHLLRDCMKRGSLRYWIEEDFKAISHSSPPCAAILYPYYIGGQIAGAIGLLGPLRIPYRKLFALLRNFSEVISETLRKNVYKYKISYRKKTDQNKALYLEPNKHLLIETSKKRLLE